MSQHWNPTKNIQQTTQQATLNATYNINLFANKLAKTNTQTQLLKIIIFGQFLKHHNFFPKFEKSSILAKF
jgi:hypothetical protein